MKGDEDFAGKRLNVPGDAAKRLSDVLVYLGWIDEDELAKRLEVSKKKVLQHIGELTEDNRIFKCTINGTVWIKAQPHTLAEWFNEDKEKTGVGMYG